MQQREYPVTMSSNKWMHERQSSVTHRVPCCSVPVTNCPSLLQSTEDGQRASSQSPVLWLLRGAACHHGAGRALMSDAQNKLQRHTVNACPRNKKTDPRNDTLQLLSSPWDVFTGTGAALHYQHYFTCNIQLVDLHWESGVTWQVLWWCLCFVAVQV